MCWVTCQLRAGHVFVNIKKARGLTRVSSARILTPAQWFCYFPRQHLVLISFLVRLRLRPIRADYQRGVWSRVHAHYDSCPQGEAKMKETSTLCTSTHALARACKALLSSAYIWAPCSSFWALLYLQSTLNLPTKHGSNTRSIIPYWPVADGSLRRYRMECSTSVPQGELELLHWCNH